MGDGGRFFWVPNFAPEEGEVPTRWRLQVGNIRIEVFRRLGDGEGWRGEAKYLCGGAGVIYDMAWFAQGLERAKESAMALACVELEKQLNLLRNAKVRELVFSEDGKVTFPSTEEERC